MLSWIWNKNNAVLTSSRHLSNPCFTLTNRFKLSNATNIFSKVKCFLYTVSKGKHRRVTEVICPAWPHVPAALNTSTNYGDRDDLRLKPLQHLWRKACHPTPSDYVNFLDRCNYVSWFKLTTCALVLRRRIPWFFLQSEVIPKSSCTAPKKCEPWYQPV